jgi:hypothetical protein
MKDKTYEKHYARVLAYIDKWLVPLGLGWYSFEVLGYEKEKEFRKGNGGVVAMRIWCDWRYMTASLSINVPAIRRMTDDELERAVVHELIHIIVNEMREGGIDHEERTVSWLTKAFFWVRNAGVEERDGS